MVNTEHRLRGRRWTASPASGTVRPAHAWGNGDRRGVTTAAHSRADDAIHQQLGAFPSGWTLLATASRRSMGPTECSSAPQRHQAARPLRGRAASAEARCSAGFRGPRGSLKGLSWRDQTSSDLGDHPHIRAASDVNRPQDVARIGQFFNSRAHRLSHYFNVLTYL